MVEGGEKIPINSHVWQIDMLVIIIHKHVTVTKHFTDKCCNTSSTVSNKQHSLQTKISISSSKNAF